MGTLITTTIMITLLLTSSLLVLTATEAHPQYGHPQYGDIIYYSPSKRPAVPPAPIPSGPAIPTHHYAVHPPADSAVDVGRKKMKAAEDYQAVVEAFALAG